MMRGVLVLGAIALALLPARALAQDCVAVRAPVVTRSFADTPNEVSIIEGGAELSCPGGKRLFADRAVSARITGRIELMGNVRYYDPERTLTAQRAEYYKQEQYIHATGNVVIRDLKTGSSIYGQEINYKQAGSVRQQDTLQALPSTERPRAVLRGESRRAPADSADRRTRRGEGETTTVVADMIEVLGSQHFRGLGSAVITRDSLTAYGGIADYNQETGDMQLAPQGRIEGKNYQLLGDTVRARLERDTLREVTALRNGKLTSSEVTVEAPYIRIMLALGELERMIAVRPRPANDPAGGLLPPQPRILAQDFRLSADSIDVLAPKQELEQVIAIGNAFSSTNDTIPAPPEVGELADALGTDWMRGDTVQAYFSANPRAQTDTAANSRVLDRVVSSGSPASSLYRRRELLPPAAPAAADTTRAAPAAPVPQYEIGYLLARRIEVIMVDGEVRDVNASEDVRGVYLQPRPGAAASQAARRNGQRP